MIAGEELANLGLPAQAFLDAHEVSCPEKPMPSELGVVRPNRRSSRVSDQLRCNSVGSGQLREITHPDAPEIDHLGH
jgi:hypothetical protein